MIRNEFESAPFPSFSSLFPSTNFPKTNYISKNILFLLTLRSDQTPRIRIKSVVIDGHYTISHLLRTTSIFHSSTVLPLSNFPHPWFGHPLKNLHRITFGSRISIERADNSCLPLHTIDVPFRRTFDLFFFLPRFSRRTRDRALTWREGMPVVTIVKNPTG